MLNTRIKEVRIEAELSQRAFAERIGVTGGSVAKLEGGENNPSEQTIRAICSQFKINRRWLETGEGEMHPLENEDDEIIDEVLAGEDEFVKAVIRGIAKTPGGWEAMRDIFTAIQAELDKNKPEV